MANPAAQATDSQTVVKVIDEDGRVRDVMHLGDRAIQLLPDSRGVLHMFGVTGYDPLGRTERRVELWHRSFDGENWSARESLLHASLINWPSSGQVAVSGQNNVLHLVVPFADSTGRMGMLYTRGNTGQWVSTVASTALAAFATLAELPNHRIAVAYLHGNRRSGDVNNVYAAIIDSAGNLAPPALVHKTGKEPALAVFLRSTAGDGLRLVFSQRTNDGSMAIKQSRSEDGGLTWGTAGTRATIRNLIRATPTLARCGEPAIIASYANEQNNPQLGIIEPNKPRPLTLGGTPIDFGLGSGMGGENLLITSEVGTNGSQWVIRRLKD